MGVLDGLYEQVRSEAFVRHISISAVIDEVLAKHFNVNLDDLAQRKNEVSNER